MPFGVYVVSFSDNFGFSSQDGSISVSLPVFYVIMRAIIAARMVRSLIPNAAGPFPPQAYSLEKRRYPNHPYIPSILFPVRTR